MKEYDAIIIGAGVAGLFSAFKLSCAGKKTLLIERQPVPGGFATVFERKGYTFESSLHCVNALGPEGEIREFLEKEGLDKEINFIALKNFCRVIYPEHDFVADFDKANFIGYLKENFPHEEKGIARLFSRFDNFYKEFDRFYHSDLPDWLNFALAPFIYPQIVKASLVTADQLISKYIHDKQLKCIITDIWRFMGLPPGRLSAFYFLIVFRGYYYEPTAYIKGSFSRLFEAMIARIKKNGCEVNFNTTVQKIITCKDRAVAVTTDRNEEFRAKVIISNANAVDTLTVLLDDQKTKDEYRLKLAALEKSISAFQVYLGLDIPAGRLGMSQALYSINTIYDHNAAFGYALSGDYDLCSLEVVDHARLDQGLAPEGKGALSIMVLDNYANWLKLTEDDYKRKKIEIANKLIDRVEKYLPGLSDHIEVTEIATPLTMARYVSSPDGAIYGFAQTPLQASINRLSRLTKIKGLILAGAWTQPGAGVHGCFVSGIEAAGLALKRLK